MLHLRISDWEFLTSGYLLFAGVNFGLQAGVGAGSYVGYMNAVR